MTWPRGGQELLSNMFPCLYAASRTFTRRWTIKDGFGCFLLDFVSERERIGG
jgi:hypothetical protein